jgi:hypothetical protein
MAVPLFVWIDFDSIGSVLICLWFGLFCFGLVVLVWSGGWLVGWWTGGNHTKH